jgi:hypothetical protein
MKTIVWGAVGAALLLVVLSPGGRTAGGPGSEGEPLNSPKLVRWETIVGNPLPANPSFANPIAGIPAGTIPWSTLAGQAYVDLKNSVVDFAVRGLVFGSSDFVGTTGAVKQIVGTVVCAPQSIHRLVINTPAVNLSPQGDAHFRGWLTSSTAGCSGTETVFLIRNASNGRWIAYGAVRVTESPNKEVNKDYRTF